MWLLVILVGVVVVVALAALSDRRDRKRGVDPKLRAEALTHRRKDLRRQRGDARAAFRATRRRRPDDRPWER